jgi:hypothetical protein
MCYGDLNGGAGLGEFDSGTDVKAPAPTIAKSMRLERDIGRGGVQKRWIRAALATSVRISKCSADD